MATQEGTSPQSQAGQDVDIEFGTGALKVTPGHDANDYADDAPQPVRSTRTVPTLSASARPVSGGELQSPKA